MLLTYLDIMVVGGADDHVILYNDQLHQCTIVFSVCVCSFLMEASHHPVTFPGRLKLVIVAMPYVYAFCSLHNSFCLVAII